MTKRASAASSSKHGSSPGKLPDWLRHAVPKRPHLAGLGRKLSAMGLHTVCQSARCPNLGECYSRGRATFMILGDVCTRECRFCAVGHGRPAPVNPEEPRLVAQAAGMLGLEHVVITSVTRDDLPDGGAAHFAATIAAVRELLPHASVEVLVPDFQGSRDALSCVVAARPEVLNHNVETVPRLYPTVRPQADYRRSLELLRQARHMSSRITTKSGFMVGLGETEEEVLALLRELRAAGTEAVTIGQYLPPTRQHLPVAEYVPPERFREYAQAAHTIGFPHVFSAPLVRSSYHAEELISRRECPSQCAD